jgi:hypothetical protein
VKPYVKTNKSDYIDAEAIAEAVGRPRMRFVPIKTDDQLDIQSLHGYATGFHHLAIFKFNVAYFLSSTAGSPSNNGILQSSAGIVEPT